MAGYVYGSNPDALAAMDRAWSAQREAAGQRGIAQIVQAANMMQNMRAQRAAAEFANRELQQRADLEREGFANALRLEEMRGERSLRDQSFTREQEWKYRKQMADEALRSRELMAEQDRLAREAEQKATALEKKAQSQLRTEEGLYDTLNRRHQEGLLKPWEVDQILPSVTDDRIRNAMLSLRDSARRLEEENVLIAQDVADRLNLNIADKNRTGEEDIAPSWWQSTKAILPVLTRKGYRESNLEAARKDLNTAAEGQIAGLDKKLQTAVVWDPDAMMFKVSPSMLPSPRPETQRQQTQVIPQGSQLEPQETTSYTPVSTSEDFSNPFPQSGRTGYAPLDFQPIVGGTPDLSAMQLTFPSGDNLPMDIGGGAKPTNGGFTYNGSFIPITKGERQEVVNEVRRLMQMIDPATGGRLHTVDSATTAALNALHQRKINALRGQ